MGGHVASQDGMTQSDTIVKFMGANSATRLSLRLPTRKIHLLSPTRIGVWSQSINILTREYIDYFKLDVSMKVLTKKFKSKAKFLQPLDRKAQGCSLGDG